MVRTQFHRKTIQSEWNEENKFRFSECEMYCLIDKDEGTDNIDQCMHR